ncbi:MAG: hypothetical protein J1E80_00850 [Desulfovibrionaceae bacterium]|nr:hypothetical protein [Desulfovibrionaceae bacterium]
MEHIDKNIFPYLGNRSIAEITPPELLAALRKIEVRGVIDQAHRVRGICFRIFATPLPPAALSTIRARNRGRWSEKRFPCLEYSVRSDKSALARSQVP